MATTFQKCKTDKKHKEYPCTQSRCKHAWTVRYREPGGRAGRQREKSFPTQKAANDYGVKMENDKREGVYLDPKRGAVPVRIYAEKWMGRQHMAPNTEGTYDRAFRLHIFPALGNRLLSSLRAADIEELGRSMTVAGLSANSVDAYMTPLRAVCKAAVINGDIARSPFIGAKLPKLPSKAVDETLLPSGQQVQDISDEFRRDWALSVWIMAALGLRTGEMLALREGDFLDDRVRVRRQVTRGKKGQGPLIGPLKHRQVGDWRDIPLPTHLREAVAAHVAACGTGPNGELFQTLTGTLVATTDYSTAFRKVIKTLGFDWSPHDLRHWFASTALSSGLPLLDVSRWLGHKSINETADTYGHLTPDSTGRAIAVMDVAITQHRADVVLTMAA
ncbi:tyrosine-type recombinase/integrase [Streptomyces chrestomyceticus]|uniref:tyrosine-type recombinase/integrase n=1 Tax=Streptomyces chrestomyceticus TaxID=68185 RepID=UPI0035A858F9